MGFLICFLIFHVNSFFHGFCHDCDLCYGPCCGFFCVVTGTQIGVNVYRCLGTGPGKEKRESDEKAQTHEM